MASYGSSCLAGLLLFQRRRLPIALTVFRMLWQRGESTSDSRRGFNPPEFGPGHAGHRESAKLVQTAAETSPVSK